MVVNFRARGISRGARKLARTPTIIKKKKKKKTDHSCHMIGLRIDFVRNNLKGDLLIPLLYVFKQILATFIFHPRLILAGFFGHGSTANCNVK
jgi:hypothetical protein